MNGNLTDNNDGVLHAPSETGMDPAYAERTSQKQYRTTPLRGLWSHAKGGYYHDGRFATLVDVIGHYNGYFTLSLSEGEVRDLAEYLKSL